MLKNISWCYWNQEENERIHSCGSYSRAACYLHFFSRANISVLVLNIPFAARALVCRKLLRVSPVPLLHKCGGAVCLSRPSFNSWPFGASS